ncbi:ABC transporter substrate-binding protein [Micromonospora sp. BRA006-A]|nr:ABC transporter substrate-binding protein [Micromonospora sp. BRA006-A]
MANPLFARYLTTWKDDGKGGLVLVGDLAETPGKNVNNDCKVWEFTIKDGVKFEDGSPITSKEIAYGIARSFDPDLTGGPTYIQEWLADTAQYDTKWDFKKNKTSLPPGLTTPDDKTLRFEFAKPRCDLPFAVSLPTTAPLKPEKDTGVNLDQKPFSSGPYKIAKNQVGVQLTLDRNPNWDAKTDPVRHQYPDQFVWSFGPTADAANNRVIADNGADQSALAFNSVPASLVAKVAGDPALKSRTLLSPTPSANQLVINTQRVKDLKIRQALNYAIDREGLVKALGGQTVAQPITTLMPPSTIGYKAYDAYRRAPTATWRRPRSCSAARRRSWSSVSPTTRPSRRRRSSSRATWSAPASRSPCGTSRTTRSWTRSRRRTTPGTCTSATGRRTGRAARRSCRCSTTAGPSRPRATATSRTSTTTRSTPRWTGSWRCRRPSRARSGASSMSGS